MNPRSFAAAALCVLAQAVYAQVEDPVLVPGNRALSVGLPSSAFSRAGAALAIDLDGYDVSAFSRVDGTTLEIELETPLSGGQHALSVLLFLPDGAAEVVYDGLLDVPQIEGAQWSLNTTLQTNYRASQHPDLDFEGFDRAAGDGSLSLGAERTSGKWQLASAVDAIYDGDDAASSGNEPWLLPTYELSATHLGTSAQSSVGAGNIRIARDDLLFSKFHRRGAAVESAATSGRFDFEAFSVASSPRNGFDGDYLMPRDSNTRSGGVAGSAKLIDDLLQIGGGFIDGKTAFGGAGFNHQDDTAIYGGDSWNVTVDSRPMKGSLWLHLEQAQSEFDADGIGVGMPARTDDAAQARLRLSSMGRFGSGPLDFWSADLLHKRVGSAFYSLGNLAAPGNIEVDGAALQAGKGSVVVDLELTRQRTNPDDDPLLPTQTLRKVGIDVSYAPATLDPDSRLWQRLGVPSLTGWLRRSDASQPESDALLAGFDVDNRTEEAGVAVTFAGRTLSWSLEVGVVDYADRSDAIIDGGFLVYEPPSDSRNVEASVQVGWVPSDRVMLDAYLQRNDFEENDFASEYRSTNYGLNGTFFFVPNKLSLFMSINQGRDRSDFGDLWFLPEDFMSAFASMQLNWLVTEAAGRHPGFSLYVKASHARNEDRIFLLDDQTSSIYVGATLSWARKR